ncbi:hypothetical protein MJD09_17050 [bacterium]|nr:hypothetical protein [bacterium]
MRVEHDFFGKKKIFPDGAIELIINLSQPQKLLDPADLGFVLGKYALPISWWDFRGFVVNLPWRQRIASH